VLRHLRATNFAILSDVALELGPGLNALTGETGAGKSLIVEAVNLLRGGRASANIPRAGAKEAVVEAIFDVPADLGPEIAALLDDAGLPDHGSELLVRRVIHRGGRSRTYINGALTTASRLADIGSLLVDLSSQHQHQGLTDPRHHRAVLDVLAAAGEALEGVAAAYRAVREIDDELEQLRAGDGLDDRRDFILFQLSELDDAEIGATEIDEIEAERRKLAGADTLVRAAAAVTELLYGDAGSAVDQINSAEAELERAADIDPDLAAHVSTLAEARALLEDVAASARRIAADTDADPERLEALDERLALIKRLARKHGGSVEAALARAAELRAELEAIDNREARVAELEATGNSARQVARQRAAALTELRRKAARPLETQVNRALAGRGLAAAQLSVAITACELGEHGADRVELMLCSNRGEQTRPLAKIASGGELSRIMLALKLVLRGAENVSCYVFDEVDTGIGGATAEVVGQQIRTVADSRQVLCVTHLAPIAAFADHHFRVEKVEVDGRTETRVDRLVDAGRTDEIARMLSGARITPRARDHARELLGQARPGPRRKRRSV
jgi:DNA repair protein RecN (Recombination protein N)